LIELPLIPRSKAVRSQDSADAALPAPAGSPGVIRFLAGLPAARLLGLIALYQRVLSPALPVLTLGRCGCRFSPTCSHYAADAIRVHGAITGTWLAAVRLAKCTPLHPGGFDPVPAISRPPRAHPPTCTRLPT
jgi:putative membrane protein insertion efficiency factor